MGYIHDQKDFFDALLGAVFIVMVYVLSMKQIIIIIIYTQALKRHFLTTIVLWTFPVQCPPFKRCLIAYRFHCNQIMQRVLKPVEI